MLTPSRARQEERINVRVFLPLRLECNNFRLVRTITVRCEFFDLFEAFCTRLSAAVATHPGACEYRGHACICGAPEIKGDAKMDNRRISRGMNAAKV